MPALLPLRRRRLGAPARFVAGPRVEDAVRVAGELVAGGRRVALDHVPGGTDDVAAELSLLAGRIAAAGLAAACELDLPVDRLGPEGTRRVMAAAAADGVAVCLRGLPAGDPGGLPGSPRLTVSAGEPGAEQRCRSLADRPVRLTGGRGASADLGFVRCLNVLMAGRGHLAVATADPRLLAVTGERAAWYDRSHDTWEYVMPYGRRTDEQLRLVAAGATVRGAVLSGAGATGALLRRLTGGGLR